MDRRDFFRKTVVAGLAAAGVPTILKPEKVIAENVVRSVRKSKSVFFVYVQTVNVDEFKEWISKTHILEWPAGTPVPKNVIVACEIARKEIASGVKGYTLPELKKEICGDDKSLEYCKKRSNVNAYLPSRSTGQEE